MSAKQQQLNEFLEWLKAKQTELADSYWIQPVEAKKIYRRLLMRIHVEIVDTERLLKIL